MAVYATILVDEPGPVARITVNRPEKRNPIGPSTCGELVQALAELKARAEVRVVVLTGAGTVFSAGGDLAAMQPPLLAPAFSASTANVNHVSAILSIQGCIFERNSIDTSFRGP